METNQYIEEEQKNKNNGEQNLIKDMFKEAKNEEDEALKKELGSDYKYIMGENNNDNLIPEEEYGEKPYYESIGVRYSFLKRNNMYVGVNVNAHLTKADFTELTLGIRMR